MIKWISLRKLRLVIGYALLVSYCAGTVCIDFASVVAVRKCAEILANKSQALLLYLNKVEDKYGTLSIDTILPSLYTFQAVALFEMRRLPEAVEALKKAVDGNPADLRAWSNLADLETMMGRIADGNKAYDMMESLSGRVNLGMKCKRIRWNNLEQDIYSEQKLFLECLTVKQSPACDRSRFTSSMDFVDLNGSAKMELDIYFAREFALPPHEEHIASPKSVTIQQNKVLVVGFVIALMDGGPVNALMQSLLRHLNRAKVVTVAFLLSTENKIPAQWLADALGLFDEVVSLQGLSDRDSAATVAQRGVDVLFDTNGYSYLTGIHVLKYRPSRVQVNFLGDPTSAALGFFDYYLGDARANPVDTMAAHFSEKFALLPPPHCYIANSHSEWTPDVLLRRRPAPSELPFMSHTGGGEGGLVRRLPAANTCVVAKDRCCGVSAQLLLGVFHTYNKFDPVLFGVWMNILRRSPATALVFNFNPSDAEAMRNLVLQGQFHGAPESRVLFLSLTKWFAHTHFKSGLDLYLDTVRKNGHTTTIDAAWAGLPTVALGAQDIAERRSAESVLHAAGGNTHGLVYSLKEYEDLAVALTANCRGRSRLAAWRRFTERVRLFGSLFNGRQYADAFVQTLQGMAEASALKDEENWAREGGNAQRRPAKYNNSNFHVFSLA